MKTPSDSAPSSPTRSSARKASSPAGAKASGTPVAIGLPAATQTIPFDVGSSAASSHAHWRTVGPERDPSARSETARETETRAGAARRADEVGRALQSAFGEIIRRLPAGVGKVADVARWLDLDRSICQRVVLGVRDAADGLGVLERFPGVRGLDQFIAAAEARGATPVTVAAARSALGAYAALINEAGGSQARLVGQIGVIRAEGEPRESPTPADEERFRRKIYEGAVGLTGVSSKARVEVIIIGPAENGGGGRIVNGSEVTTVSATGFIGVEMAPQAMPIVRKSRIPGLTPVPAGLLGGSTAAARASSNPLAPDLLLAPFTSEPPPRVTMRTEGEQLMQVIQPDGAQGLPFDVVAALAFSWNWGTPAVDGDSAFYSVGRIIGTPTRALVLDLYLHRDLPAPRAVAAHVIRPSTQGSLGNARPSSRWYDRIPVEHDLTLLAGQPGDRRSDAYPRLGELTRHLLKSMQWEGQTFTGYRFEVTYPMFDIEYVIGVEY